MKKKTARERELNLKVVSSVMHRAYHPQFRVVCGDAEWYMYTWSPLCVFISLAFNLPVISSLHCNAFNGETNYGVTAENLV